MRARARVEVAARVNPVIPGEMDDRQIVEHALRDPRAFAPLYERYLDPIYRYCYRRLGTRELAEDAASQVFHNALSALHTFRGGSFRSWLFAIAHNVVTDRYRRARETDTLDAAGDVADASATPEETALAEDERRSLQALIAQLTPDQQQVVQLRLAGLTGIEIAHALGRSSGAVKLLQFRAIARLRALLGVDVPTTNASTTKETTGDD